MPSHSERSQILSVPSQRFPWFAVLLALLVHTVLVVLLAVGVNWSTHRAVEAEGVQLWSEADIRAAVRESKRPQNLRRTEQTAQPVRQPVAEPATTQRPPPPDRQPEPDRQPAVQPDPQQSRQADIALREREKKEREAKERQEQEKARREAVVKAREEEQKKREQERQAKAEAEQRKKDEKLKAILAQRRQEQAQRQAQERERREARAAEQAERSRAEALARMTTAGADEAAAERTAAQTRLGGGGQGARGSGSGKSGISSAYAGRIKARVRRFVNFVDDRVEGNPRVVVIVRVNSRGEIQGAPGVAKSSGYPAFDRAIVNAFIDAQKLPPDVDGSYPTPLRIGWSLHD